MNIIITKKSLGLSILLSILSLFFNTGYAEDTFQATGIWPKIAQNAWYFNNPRGMARDSQGHIYVTDEGTNSVRVFNEDGEFIRSWGKLGTGDGEFNNPFGITVSESGFVYVVDKKNNRIQVFNTDGIFLTKWGSQGAGPGQFNFPHFLAVSRSGLVYVADRLNNRIQVFNGSGKFIRQWGTKGTEPGQLLTPQGVAFDSEESLYVTDSNNHRVQVFSKEGTFLRSFAEPEAANGQFKILGGISIDEKDQVFITDFETEEILLFSKNGDFIRKWGGFGFVNEKMNNPWGIVAQNGQVWVADNSNNRIQIYDTNGVYLIGWQSQGSAIGQFVVPHIAVGPNKLLYVTDQENHRIQIFDENGEILSTFGEKGSGSGDFNQPTDITFDTENRMYVVDAINARVQVFSLTGEFISSWKTTLDETEVSRPRAIAISPINQQVYVSIQNHNRIQVYTKNGEFLRQFGHKGTGDGEFDFPADLVINNNGLLIVADSRNDRIQAFSSDDMFVGKVGSLGNGPLEFNKPKGLDLTSDGLLYIADANNSRIQILRITGEFFQSFTEPGSALGQINKPSSIAHIDNNTFYVAEEANNRIQKFVRTQSNTGNNTGNKLNKAIILAGGGPSTETYSNLIWDATELLTNKAVDALNIQGYSLDQIKFLTAGNIDSSRNYELEPASLANLELAITEWSADAENVVIYLVDHGGPGKFQVNSEEILNTDQLNSWVSQLQSKIPGKTTVIIEACKSGSFLNSISISGHPFIASSNAEQPAVISNGGLNSFSYYFWSEISSGGTLQTAFKRARQGMSSHIFKGKPQSAQLDFNGDKILNQSDYNVLENFCLGNCTTYAANPPTVNLLTPEPNSDNIVFNNKTQMDFSLQVTNLESIISAWALITRPDFDHPDSDEPVSDLPLIELSCDSQSICRGNYNQFNRPGEYQIDFYVKDANLDQSLAKKVIIEHTLPLFDEATGQLFVPYVVVDNIFYQAELQMQSNGIFTLTSGTQLPDSAIPHLPATYDTNSLLLTIPDVFALQKHFRATLINQGNFNFSLQETTELSPQ